MTFENKQKVLDLVRKICGTTVSYPEAEHIDEDVNDVPTDKTWDAAYEILSLIGITESACIEEIPLCWGDQVCIRFTIGSWDTASNHILFDLTAGVSCNDNDRFFICLQVENEFDDFPVSGDDDVGIYLMRDTWPMENGKIAVRLS